MRQEPPMFNKISFATARAALLIDHFLDRVALFAWTSTLRHHADVDGGSSAVRPRASKHAG
jgi:hypothetical protein